MKRSVGHEQYFTDPELAWRCVAFAASLLAFEEFDMFVEPSAGEGAFLRLLPEERRIGIDLEPRDADIARADFLQWEPPTLTGPILTIGNPPFGQRAALAMDFMARACTFSAAVAFILPRSFNKYTFQDRVDPRFHLLGSFDCDGFYDKQGAKQSIRTCFQVWSKGEHERSKAAHQRRICTSTCGTATCPVSARTSSSPCARRTRSPSLRSARTRSRATLSR